ncbi:hypothetical protein CWI75_13175 [Kineobactrum sediminis]|uniref:SnoaL-like domain-containing protein n=1 Tax=Kineobactrum sediminis TaxID=1905677 RepID=A0A2N5Y0V8_9GAMM|nr:nuclear transport factor 2 family protein [Kineobactrum sediminis]PLW82028.1 hypothetical protein CWI75_13175 [Kineobactrum sediminis]
MSTFNKAVVKQFLEAAQAGDTATTKQLLHPDVRVIEADSLPFGGIVTGFDGFSRLVRQVFTTFAETAVTVQEYLADGDSVVVLATMTGKSKASGESFRMPIAEIWRLREGRIVEIQPFYHDTQKINAMAKAP